jgi:tungstate transport system ATP-binding protein
MIELMNIKKVYNGRTVLDIPRGFIPEGGITALIGPSGSGKSTLLNIVNGLIKPDEGKVRFLDYEHTVMKEYPPEAIKRMALVFQKPVMFNTTVYENIAYGLKVRNFSKPEIREKVEFIAEWTGLKDLLKQKAVTLSGGEAERVSLTRAMVLNPELLLMDEPTANLDPVNVAIIEDMILRFNREFGTSIIIVTHNMFQAKRLGHQVIFLMNGQILETGPREQVFNHPQNEQTQNFISGQMIY